MSYCDRRARWALIPSPSRGGSRVGMGFKMLGQSNKKIKSRRLPQRLRRTMTQAERRLWSALRLQQLRGFKFRRQHLLGNYVLDFVCISTRLVIEVDGGNMRKRWLPMSREVDF